jgi:hypothetical protein
VTNAVRKLRAEMDGKFDHLLRDVLGLTREEQEEVLSTILVSLDQSETVDREWLVAAHRRFDAIRSQRIGQVRR